MVSWSISRARLNELLILIRSRGGDAGFLELLLRGLLASSATLSGSPRWKTLASALSTRLIAGLSKILTGFHLLQFRMNERIIFYAKVLTTALERV